MKAHANSRAQYLLRFDDLCPTLDRGRWQRFLPLIERYSLRPILAVVPDNQDPELQRGPADPGFWAEMRELEAAGAAIGIHGFQHVCMAKGRSLIPLYRTSEFAGATREAQKEWIRAGLAILRGRGLNPRIWVAPRHGFDRVTLQVLREEGIGLVSDGFAGRSFRHHGVTWIPQQIWAPVAKKSGLWTICLHSNSTDDGVVAQLEDFLARFGSQFTSVDRVLAEWPIENRAVPDQVFRAKTLMRIRVSKLRRRLRIW